METPRSPNKTAWWTAFGAFNPNERLKEFFEDGCSEIQPDPFAATIRLLID